MNMTQLIVGAAVGVLAAEGTLHGGKLLVARLRRDTAGTGVSRFSRPSGRAIVHASLKYGALAGAVAAFVTLGVWATGAYVADRSERAAAAGDTELAAATPASSASDSPGAGAALAPPTKADGAAPATAASDPYADPEFKVQRPRGKRLSLKDSLVRHEEAKARSELLGEMKQHQSRSQYDCEAAERASRYLKAGLDVWGFAAWQVKHFPMEAYDGATLDQCQKIKDVLAPSHLDLHDAVAQGNDPGQVSTRDAGSGQTVVATSQTLRTPER